MPLARFIAFHDLAENDTSPHAPLHFAVVLARARDGVVLVFNRYRRVWELEEAGCEARGLTWLGVVEVHDGRTHFGAVFHCEVDAVPARLENEEIGGLARWSAAAAPHPLGATDAALLKRFGVAR